MFQKLMALLKDAHIPIALLVFAVTTGYHFTTHIDLGANYANTIYATYGFLGGHAFINRKDGDKGSE